LFAREEETQTGVIALKRRRFKQTSLLEERIRDQAKRVRDEANNLPPGKERDALLKKARDADAAEKVNGWLTSTGSQPPE
jgi:hypothetical protein